jgi:Short C-terminal domain/Uncharacterized lipoprotein
MKFSVIALVGVAIILQTGCVVGRRTFPLAITSHDIPAPSHGTVYITAVTDDRDFQNKPADPSTPSIDGDVTKLSAKEKDQMIGRQRNGFGKAMGDIALPADDSVTKRTRLLVEQSLQRKGYQISTDPSASEAVTVSVKEFWAWMTPGFIALTFEAKLSCTIAVTDASGLHTAIVKGYGINHGQVVKDGNWQEAYDPAFEDFIANFGVQWDNLALRGPGDPGATRAAGSAQGDVYEQLKKLDELRKAGILTQEEFDTQKRKLLEQ